MKKKCQCKAVFPFVALVMALLVLPATAAEIPDKLPDPDGKPADQSKPVQVFILMGQSNMLGSGRVGAEDQNGTLEHQTKKEGKYPHLIDEEGNWTVRNHVQYVQTTVGNRQHPLTIQGRHIGVEVQFGHIMGHIHDEPVLILKACIGNRSLGWDLLPPGSEQSEYDGRIYAGYKESPLSWEKGTEPQPIAWYAGKQYDTDTGNAKEVLKNLAKYYPDYKGQGYEVAGFVFWQGHKDQNPAHAARYEQNLVHFIKTLRKDFDAPEAKFVLARAAGVKDPAVDRAIERSPRLLRFYIGKGAVPYGDHHPWTQTHEDNGKCGMAAVMFNLLGEAEGAEFFSRMSVASHDPAAAQALILDGRGWSNKDRKSAYDKLAEEELMTRLGSWSPIVRERAAMALARRKGDAFPALLKMLKSPRLESRYGACQALAMLKGAAAPAVPALKNTLRHDDLWLRVKAAEALANIGEPAMSAVPELLEMLAKGPSENDPRGMEQRYLCFAIFGQMLKRSLDGVDRGLLRKAVAAGLQNQDGRARGTVGGIYQQLSYEEIKPLLPAIHEAIVTPAPSGIMFASGIRLAGIDLLARHHIREGMPLCIEVMDIQKWGKRDRISRCLKTLGKYGAAAKPMLPRLRELEKDLLAHHEARGLQPQIDQLRSLIKEIENATGTVELRSIH